MDMKTILVPMENSEAMQPALETALLLGRRNDAYIEGFALRWPIVLAGLDMVGGLALDSLEQDRITSKRKRKHGSFSKGLCGNMTCRAQLRQQGLCHSVG
jgi:hypothetical protein